MRQNVQVQQDDINAGPLHLRQECIPGQDILHGNERFHNFSHLNWLLSNAVSASSSGAGKTLFRERCYEEYGDEKEKSDKFHENEAKRTKAEVMPRTCATLSERNYIDMAYKRFDSEDYEWEEKKVKVMSCNNQA